MIFYVLNLWPIFDIKTSMTGVSHNRFKELDGTMKALSDDFLARNFVIDVESNGPIIGHHSLVSYGLVCVGDMDITEYQEVSPITENFVPDALAVSGFTFQETKAFQPPMTGIKKTLTWIERVREKLGGKSLILWSDNPAYDFGWINTYFMQFGGDTLYSGINPFGHSCRSIPELWCGMKGNVRDRNGWRKYKETPHTHNALDDAKGNAEALRVLLGREP